ncbi:cadherin domain-containing protein, partial [Hyphococcus lacteus]
MAQNSNPRSGNQVAPESGKPVHTNSDSAVEREDLELQSEQEALKNARETSPEEITGGDGFEGRENFHYGAQNAEDDLAEGSSSGRTDGGEFSAASDLYELNGSTEVSSVPAQSAGKSTETRFVDQAVSPEEAQVHTASFTPENWRMPSAPEFSSGADPQVQNVDIGEQSPSETASVSTLRGVPNNAPSDLVLSSQAVAENAPGIVVAELSAFDPDKNDIVSFSLSEDESGLFEVVGNQLKLREGISLDFETQNSYVVTIQVTDEDGAGFFQTVTLDVNDVNEAPTALTLSGSGVNENATGAIIGDVSAFDPDFGDALNYSVSDERFEVVAGQLKLKSGISLDAETANAITLEITATDSEGFETIERFTVNVNDVNEAPVDIQFSELSVDENNAGAIISTLTALDPDVGDVASFAIVSDLSDNFEITGNRLKLKDGVSLDHEAQPSFDITISVTDQNGAQFEKTVTVDVSDINETPTDLYLSDNSVSENEAGAVVATLSSSDPDQNESLTYTISEDNSGQFEIVGDQLKLKDGVTLDRESEASHDVTVEVTDSAGNSYLETVTIDVADVNEAPVDVSITPNQSNGVLSLNQRGGNDDYAIASNLEGFPNDALTVEVSFASSQTDVGNGVPLFSYAASNGGHNEALIWLNGSSGRVSIFLANKSFDTGISNSSLLDGEQHQISFSWDQSSNDLKVYVDGELSFSQSIEIRDLVSDGTLVFGQEQDAEGGRFDTSQVFEGQISEVRIFDYARSEDEISDHAGRQIDDPETEPGLVNNWIMNDTDGVVEDLVGVDHLQLKNGAQIEGGIAYGVPTVTENQNGATVGTLSASDPQTGGNVTEFVISDDASGKFEIVGDQLKLKPGASLDYENQSEHQITVKAVGADGASTEQLITVSVADVDETNTITGTERNDRLYGEAGQDTIYGNGGNDVINGRGGADTLYGGDGNDIIYADSQDTVFGGDGRDRVITQGTDGISIDMAASSVERVDGGAGSDKIDASGMKERVIQ